MSALARDTHWRWVDSQEELAALLRALEAADVVALDTEFMRERTYRPQLALLQCQTGEQTWLVDTTVALDFSPLQAWLEGPALKVLHSCREDLEVLAQALAPMAWPVWDTQLAEAFLGGPLQLSYQKIVEQYTGITLAKGETRSNWLQRPLSEAQCRYAAEDVIWLPQIQRQQAEKLRQLQRLGWFEQDMCALLAEASQPADTTRLHLAFRSASELDTASLRRLRDLLHWREQMAVKRDLPRSFILKNDVLFNLACKPPANRQALQALQLHPAFLRHHGDDLLDVVHGQSPYALADEPATPLVPFNRPEDKKALQQLREQLRNIAQGLQLEMALLGTRKDMERYLRWQRGEVEHPGRLGQGWRQDLLKGVSTAGI